MVQDPVTQTAKERFDKALRRRGGLLDTTHIRGREGYEAFRRQAMELLENARRSPSVSNMPRVHFDYYNSPEINAAALIVEGHEFIAFSRGCLRALANAFFILLEEGTALRRVGLDETSLVSSPTLKAEIDAMCADPQLMDEEGEPLSPAVQARRAYAYLLSRMATGFLLDHELAHLNNGHVAYLERHCNISAFFETDVLAKIDPLTKQTLEWDADSHAISQGVSRVLAKLERPSLFAIQRTALGTPAAGVFSWMFAIYSMFRLFVKPGPMLDELGEASHPPPSIRQVIALELFRQILDERQAGTSAVRGSTMVETVRVLAAAAMNDAIVACEQGYAMANSDTVDMQGLQLALAPESQYHMSLYRERWAAIYPDLQPLSRVALTLPDR